MDVLRLWFGLQAPVTRKLYAYSGLGLMAARVALDAAIIFSIGGAAALKLWSPMLYVSPILVHRRDVLRDMLGGEDPLLLVMLLVVTALPFAWIGLSMSVRRARNSGIPAWIGLAFLLPVFNLLAIAALCALPTQQTPQAPQPRPAPAHSGIMMSAVAAIGLSALFGTAVVAASVLLLGEYGLALFVAGPVVMGAIGGWHINSVQYRGYRAGILVGLVSSIACCGIVVLLALEGIVCLAMVAPLAIGTTMMGACLGTAIAHGASGPGPVGAMAFMLPIIGITETSAPVPLPQFQVVSSIHIDAAPEEVWPNVIGFSELPPASDWVLSTGIATPMRARIEGEGVGAIRYCEFTTGPFVEPITTWEPPLRLAFDVTSQPPAMHEWSPWEEVYAPHIEDTMLSRRGEFLLTATPDGGTLVQGTTWYTLDLAPASYWRLWSDFIVHRIHNRVLGHIKTLSESA